MRKMKKFTGIVLAAAMAVSLTACGGSTGTSGGAKTTEQDKEKTETSQTGSEVTPVDGVEELTLTLSHHCSEDDSNHVYAEAFADAVNQLSGGKMKVDIYANGQLFGQADALSALSQGTLDIALSDTALFANYDPAGALFDMPYLIDSREQAIKMVQDEEVLSFIRGKMSDKGGFHVLSIQPLYFRSSLVKDKNVNSFDGFKGLIMRTPEAPHTIAAFEAFGANPTVIPSGEAYTAVQTGVADGLEGHPEYVYLQKFYEVAQNYVQTKHVFTFTAYSMSQKVYDDLSDAQKQVIDEASVMAQDKFLEYTDTLFEDSMKKLEDEGVQITEVDLAPFKEAAGPYLEKFIADNSLQDVYDKIQSLK
ncbi:TRAP transporter substrate-binding protein [uncultured Clostridium sp.]|uniref:TRAP transporter substrate-binding protein n=1 Tax=uncultured Clostridium sp. TaxID=59620 RepID=UPI0025CD0EE2|nr:TRAP transporter substrate-binding protein [uncultured Clostridium sp.]